jgi:signal transduction histidine kinase
MPYSGHPPEVVIALDMTHLHASYDGSVGSHPPTTDRTSQQTAVAELGKAALSGQAVDDVFQMALDLAREVLNVEYAKILHQPAPDEPLVLAAGLGWNEDVRVGATTVSCDRTSQAGYTLMSTEPVLVDDLAHEDRFTAPSLLIDHGVVSGMSVTIPDGTRPFGVLGVHDRRPRSFTTDDADFLRSIAHIVGGAIQSDRSRRQIRLHSMAQEQRLRYQIALSQCAQALLSATGDIRLDRAVEALLAATQATYVFVQRNVMDPELGFCSQNIAQMAHAEAPGNDADAEYWDMVSWERMPAKRSGLERGEPFVVLPSELEGAEHELYASDPFPIVSELDIPIFTEGEWAGLIGFADTHRVREWTEEDLSLLTTVAAMIGAFWEREIGRERLEQAIRTKDDFLASVSHELRTPLTAVMGFGQILKDEAGTLPEEERAELLEAIVRQAADLTNIVNDLLVAARHDTGTLNIKLVPVTLRAQAAQALEAFDQEKVGSVALTGDFVRAIGDPHRTRQIIRNLISNALRYGGPDIRISVESNADDVSVLVRDNGSPIPVDERERIFEQYQRARGTTEIAESLGLGLAISRELARRMGGDLTYRYEDGDSVFELTLPKTD